MTGTKPTGPGTGEIPPATPHDLYRLADVEAALSPDGRNVGPFAGDPSEIPSPRSALEQIIDAGEAGCRRILVHPTPAAVERAPHMRAMTDLVVTRMRAALTIGLPLALPPVLLSGRPGSASPGS